MCVLIAASSILDSTLYKHNLVIRHYDNRTNNSKNEDQLLSIKNKNKVTGISHIQNDACVKQPNNSRNIISQINQILNSRTKLSLDYDFASKLRKAQPNNKVPLVNDIIVLNKNRTWDVYVIINNANTHNDSYKYLNNVNVTLEVNGQIYYNIFPEVKHNTIRLLKYIVPNMKQSGNISLYEVVGK